MKTIIGSIFILLVMAATLCCCNGNKTLANDNRKALLSLPDLMISKLTNSGAPKDSIMLDQIVKLRDEDNLLYKALYDEEGKPGKNLPQHYFYARSGSCCPCTVGGHSCCDCQKGTAMAGTMSTEMTQIGTKGQRSLFMLTNNSSAQPDDYIKLKLDSTEEDHMKIFKIPANAAAGKYKVSFKTKDKGKVELTLKLVVDEKGDFNIVEIE